MYLYEVFNLISFDIYIYTCKAITTIKIMIISITTKFPSCLFEIHSSHPFPLHHPVIPKQTLIGFLSLWFSLHFLEFYINGITQYVLLFVWLFSVSIIILRFIHVEQINNLFFFIDEQYLQIYINLFIHSPVDGYLGCFQFRAITNKAATNIHVQVFIWIYACILAG